MDFPAWTFVETRSLASWRFCGAASGAGWRVSGSSLSTGQSRRWLRAACGKLVARSLLSRSRCLRGSALCAALVQNRTQHAARQQRRAEATSSLPISDFGRSGQTELGYAECIGDKRQGRSHRRRARSRWNRFKQEADCKPPWRAGRICWGAAVARNGKLLWSRRGGGCGRRRWPHPRPPLRATTSVGRHRRVLVFRSP